MSIPVIIAAHNEADYLGRTLRALSPEVYDPIVIANDCEESARVAEACGATTIRVPERGKLPAIQTGIRSLGSRALEPFLLTDADSYPQFPNKYAAFMVATATTHADKPVVVTGLTRYVDGNTVVNGLRSARQGVQTRALPRESTSLSHMFGYNMLVAARTEVALEKMLALPHIWLGDDRAIGKAIFEGGGMRLHTNHPYSTVATSARLHIPLRERIRNGRRATHDRIAREYAGRAAAGSMSFDDYFGSKPL